MDIRDANIDILNYTNKFLENTVEVNYVDLNGNQKTVKILDRDKASFSAYQIMCKTDSSYTAKIDAIISKCAVEIANDGKEILSELVEFYNINLDIISMMDDINKTNTPVEDEIKTEEKQEPVSEEIPEDKEEENELLENTDKELIEAMFKPVFEDESEEKAEEIQETASEEVDNDNEIVNESVENTDEEKEEDIETVYLDDETKEKTEENVSEEENIFARLDDFEAMLDQKIENIHEPIIPEEKEEVTNEQEEPEEVDLGLNDIAFPEINPIEMPDINLSDNETKEEVVSEVEEEVQPENVEEIKEEVIIEEEPESMTFENENVNNISTNINEMFGKTEPVFKIENNNSKKVTKRVLKTFASKKVEVKEKVKAALCSKLMNETTASFIKFAERIGNLQSEYRDEEIDKINEEVTSIVNDVRSSESGLNNKEGIVALNKVSKLYGKIKKSKEENKARTRRI